MATAAAFITRQQLAARVSPILLKRALDDGNVGSASSSACDQLLLDASNKVRAGCGFVFDIDSLIDDNPPVAGELQRIALDAATGYLYQRHPEVFRMDYEKLLKRVDADLTKIRTARSNLATASSPQPERPQGAIVARCDVEGNLGDF